MVQVATQSITPFTTMQITNILALSGMIPYPASAEWVLVQNNNKWVIVDHKGTQSSVLQLYTPRCIWNVR